MSKNLRHAIYHYWLWRRDPIWGSSLTIVLCSLYYHYFPIRNLLIDGGLILLSVVLPFVLFSKDIFSWKYYQSLPMSKRELYHYHLLIQYLIYLPFLIWYYSFADVFNDFFFSSPEVGLKSYAIASGVYLVGAAFIGMASFFKGFESLRQPYVKRSGYYFFLQSCRDSLYTAAGIFLAWLIVERSIGVFFPLAQVVAAMVIVVACILALPLGYIWYYWFVFERWNKEERSYFKKNFKTLRDLPLMGISVLLMTFFLQNIGEGEIALYGSEGKSELVRAIHKSDRETFYRLLGDKRLVQRRSDTGWTPLMVAAHEGHFEFFQALNSAGAQEGRVNAPKDKFHHNMDLFLLAVDGKNVSIVKQLLTKENARSGTGQFSALHLAAYHCSLENIDLLLGNGADPNALNRTEETPLHVAAKKGCFGGAIALIDSGADPRRKDSKGRMALEYTKKNNQFAYYLMKKGRIPAGK